MERNEYIHIYIYIDIDIDKKMCVCIYIYIHAYIHTYMHTHTYIYICINMCRNMYIYIYVYLYTYAYVYMAGLYRICRQKFGRGRCFLGMQCVQMAVQCLPEVFTWFYRVSAGSSKVVVGFMWRGYSRICKVYIRRISYKGLNPPTPPKVDRMASAGW